MRGTQDGPDVFEGDDFGLVVIVDQLSQSEDDQIIFCEDQVSFFDPAVGEHDTYLFNGVRTGGREGTIREGNLRREEKEWNGGRQK
jgi:hypothetical protein